MTNSTARPWRRTRGFTLLEVVTTAMMLAVAMTLTLKILSWVAVARREAERRQLAVVEVVGAMERIAGGPWEQVNQQSASAVRPASAVLEALPEAEWSVRVEPEERPVSSKRIEVAVRWRTRSGEWAAPVRLTSWIYPRRRGK